MRILVQRVFEAWVKVDGAEFSRTSKGLLVFIGLTHDDNTDVADYMTSKILNMRLWEKEGKSWNGSVMDIEGDIMMVSQFTLYGILKGNKPDFHGSMEADKARQLFDYTVDQLRKTYLPERIQTGKFQALMEVGSNIDGPVTIEYEKSAADAGKIKKPKKNTTQKKVDAKQVDKEQTQQKVQIKSEPKVEIKQNDLKKEQ